MKKKILSLFLALVFALLPYAATFSGLAVTYPYLETDDNGNTIYHRLSNGRDVAFFTDYDEMVYHVRTALKNHDTNIEYYYATTDSEFAYSYEYANDLPTVKATANRLYSKLIDDVFELNSVNVSFGGGEYLYNSIANMADSSDGIATIGDTGINFYTSAQDRPINGVRYCTFRFSWKNIEYYTTLEQESIINSFAEWFSMEYLRYDMTEYQKVKTIYDFIVRNTTYDWDVFEGKYKSGTQRYNIAHSAYGAILGSVLDNVAASTGGAIGDVYDFDYDALFPHKTTITGEYVPDGYNNGRAVCEGYSKLFLYLCTIAGVRCHIVDGDYIAESGKSSDPHEWNYVYLKDESGDDYKWFQVDCTKSAQLSLKEIDINNYNYFLCGRESVYFGWKNHQQAYENKGLGYKYQLYDWYAAENYASEKDYIFSLAYLTKADLSLGHIIRRSTYYSADGDEKTIYIFADGDGYKRIEINEDGVLFNHTDGFMYSGYNSTFSVIIPYVVNRINVLDDGSVSEGEYTASLNLTNYETGEQSRAIRESGRYYMDINGLNGSSLRIDIEILPRNMSNEAISDDSVVIAYDRANYTGKAITPALSIIDPYHNSLSEGKNYDVYYTHNNQRVDEIKDIGKYKINIVFKDNYTGTYVLDFEMLGVDLSKLSYKKIVIPYQPKYFRELQNRYTPADYFIEGSKRDGLTVGDITIYPNTDFSVTSSGTLEYGKSGTITLTALNKPYLISGTKLVANYEINGQYDISSFDGKVADQNTTNKVYYTGSPVKPTKFDVLDTYLERGKDYEITGYSNNTEVGIGYVHIKGINGCTGTAKMQFYINRGSNTDPTPSDPEEPTKPSDNAVKPTATGNVIKLKTTSYVYDGKAKCPAVTFKNSKGQDVDTGYYTVSYANNKNVGTATAYVKLKNGYSGTFTFNFVINPKPTTLSKLTAGKKAFTAKWKKQATQTTGYQLQYATNAKFTSAKTVNITKNKTVSKAVKSLKAKKKYYVRIRTYKTISGKTYYSSWSAAKSVKTK